MNINPTQAQPFYTNPYSSMSAQGNGADPANNQQVYPEHSDDIENCRCETCSNRRYVDVSDDPGVSFQAPTRLTPGQAAIAVPSHEREHYHREAARAHREDRDILHNSIRIFTDVCPECGITFVSGGEHRIVTRSSPEEDPLPWYQVQQ